VEEDWVTPERDFTSQLNRHVYGKHLQLIIENKFNFPAADQVLIAFYILLTVHHVMILGK
jgi:hypothetical protein